MKKRLESELISIAHRVLKLKNKSELDQLYKESRKLYETLSVLKFYQDNFESIKSDVSSEEIEETILGVLDSTTPLEGVTEKVLSETERIAEVEQEQIVEVDSVNEAEEEIKEEDTLEEVNEEELVDESFEDNDIIGEEDKESHENSEEQIKEEPLFAPAFELLEDDEEVIESIEEEITLESFLGDKYKEPVFVKPGETTLFSDTIEEKTVRSSVLATNGLNTLTFNLNDRIAFVKHLFDGSDEEFNRVVSQLNSFDSLEEAKNFLNEMVIPDYHYWVGKEEYLERFMELLAQKFE